MDWDDEKEFDKYKFNKPKKKKKSKKKLNIQQAESALGSNLIFSLRIPKRR